MAEYIWLVGGSGQLRSKTKVLETKPACPSEAPVIVVESNPGNQLAEPNHELFLKPRKIFRDPFRGGDHILVLCDTFFAAQVQPEPEVPMVTVLQPDESNSRVACENVLKVAAPSQPVFAVEQEYAIIHPAYPTAVPLGPRRASRSNSSRSHSGSTVRGGISKNHSHYTKPAAPAAPSSGPLSPSICSLNDPGQSGPKAARQLADAHLRCCLFAGIKLTGADVHTLTGLHSYKIGPSEGVSLGDDLWTSRYLLQRVAEERGASVSWDPNAMPHERPLTCQFKYSSAATRQAPQGLSAIEQQLVRLQATHIQHQVAYNDGRLDRLATPEASAFTHAIGSGTASVVVPSLTLIQQGGYYVDRRPPADADPYKVTLLLTATTLDIPLPKLPATACSSGANMSGGPAPPVAMHAMAAPAVQQSLPFSPVHSYLLAARGQSQLMYDTESEECDSVDEDDCMTEDSAALLAKMDDDGPADSCCESDLEADDACSSPSPSDGAWHDVDEEAFNMGNGI